LGTLELSREEPSNIAHGYTGCAGVLNYSQVQVQSNNPTKVRIHLTRTKFSALQMDGYAYACSMIIGYISGG